MLIDITLEVTPRMVKDAQGNEKKAFTGHLGTHFDVMNKVFPIEYTERKGIVFDASMYEDEIPKEIISSFQIEEGMFVAFYTGFIDKAGYGSGEYFHHHPQLSNELIEYLVGQKISMIGIDAAGIRRGKEHPPIDQYCADHNVFVIENLCRLNEVIQKSPHFISRVFPMNFTDMTGLPCRVIAEIK